MAINVQQKPDIKLIPEDREFISLVNNRITVYGQIPYTVPEKLIIDVAKESARYFFRMSYHRSQHVVFYRLPVREIIDFITNAPDIGHANGEERCKDYPECGHNGHHLHPEQIHKTLRNLRGYGVKLPQYVNVIREIYEANETISGISSYLDGQLSTDSTDLVYNFNTGSYGTSPYGYSLIGINAMLYSAEKSVSISEQAVYRAVYGTSIPFRWNGATKTLIINKDINEIDTSLMLECDCNVPIQALYDDDLFIKYVIARVKQELKRLLGGHTFQLPGDIQMNADEICANADTEKQEVDEVLKGGSGVGDIILQR